MRIIIRICEMFERTFKCSITIMRYYTDGKHPSRIIALRDIDTGIEKRRDKTRLSGTHLSSSNRSIIRERVHK